MQYSVIGGGATNRTYGQYGTIPGGRNNVAGLATKGPNADPKTDEHATVGGGLGNTSSGAYSTICGGTNNTASGASSFVGGGQNNSAIGGASVVVGGIGNTADGGAAVGGGGYNYAGGGYSVVAGGWYCSVDSGADYSTVAGGRYNRAAGRLCAVGGGGGYDSTDANVASGWAATVPGGRANEATGDYSFAAGRRAKANHSGVFVWADGTDADFASSAVNQFLVRADGGVGINVNDPSEDIDVNGTARFRGIPSSVTVYNTVMADGNGKLWKLSAKSSERYKENIRNLEVDPANVLRLDPVKFSWKESGQEDVGLIAEDVAKLIPELVIYDEENRPDGVKYDKVVLYLLAALKELRTENEILKGQLGELSRTVETILATQNESKSGDDKLTLNR